MRYRVIILDKMSIVRAIYYDGHSKEQAEKTFNKKKSLLKKKIAGGYLEKGAILQLQTYSNSGEYIGVTAFLPATEVK